MNKKIRKRVKQNKAKIIIPAAGVLVAAATVGAIVVSNVSNAYSTITTEYHGVFQPLENFADTGVGDLTSDGTMVPSDSFWGLIIKGSPDANNYWAPYNFYVGQWTRVIARLSDDFYGFDNTSGCGTATYTSSDYQTLNFDNTNTAYANNFSGNTTGNYVDLYVSPDTNKFTPSNIYSLDTENLSEMGTSFFKSAYDQTAIMHFGNTCDPSYTQGTTYYMTYTADETPENLGDVLWQFYLGYLDGTETVNGLTASDKQATGSSTGDYTEDYSNSRLYARNAMALFTGSGSDNSFLTKIINACANKYGWQTYDSRRGIYIKKGDEDVTTISMISTGISRLTSCSIYRGSGDSNCAGYFRYSAVLYTSFGFNVKRTSELSSPVVSALSGNTEWSTSPVSGTVEVNASEDDWISLARDSAAGDDTIGSIQYYFSSSKLSNTSSITDWSDYTAGDYIDLSGLTWSTEGDIYLYLRTFKQWSVSDNPNKISSEVTEYHVTKYSSNDITVSSTVTDQSRIAVGDSVTFSATDGNEVIYSIYSSTDTDKPVLTRVSLADQLDDTNTGISGTYLTDGNHICLNGIWYECNNQMIVTAGSSVTYTVQGSQMDDNVLTMYVLAVKNGCDPGSFKSYHFYRDLAATVETQSGASLDSAISKDELIKLSNTNTDASGNAIGSIQYYLSNTAVDTSSITDGEWSNYTTVFSPVSGETKYKYLYTRIKYDSSAADGDAISTAEKYNVKTNVLSYLPASSLIISASVRSESSVSVGSTLTYSSDGSAMLIYAVNPSVTPSLTKVSSSDVISTLVASLTDTEKTNGAVLLVTTSGADATSYIRLNGIWYESNTILEKAEPTAADPSKVVASISAENSSFSANMMNLYIMPVANGSEVATSFSKYVYYRAVNAPTVGTESGRNAGTEAIPTDDVIILSNNNVDGAGNEITGTLQYSLSKTLISDTSSISDWSTYNSYYGIDTKQRNYIYTRFTYQVNGVTISSPVQQTAITYFSEAGETVTFNPAANSLVNSGDSITLSTSDGSKLYYYECVGATASLKLTKLPLAERRDYATTRGLTSGTDVVSVINSGKLYIRVNNLWYECSNAGVKEYTGALSVSSEIDTKQYENIYAIALSNGKNVGSFDACNLMTQLKIPVVNTESGTDISSAISVDDEILMSYPAGSSVGALQYYLSDSEVAAEEITGWINYSSSISTQGKKFLYTRIAYDSGSATITSDLEQGKYELTYIENSTATVTASTENGSNIDYGHEITLTATGELTIYGVDLSVTPEFKKVNYSRRISLGLDSVSAATNAKTTADIVTYKDSDGYMYIRVNNLWYVSSVTGLSVYESNTIKAGDNLRISGALSIYAISLDKGKELGEFTTFRYGLGLSDQVAAPTSLIGSTVVSTTEVNEVAIGDTITLMTSTTNDSAQMVPVFYTVDGSAPVITIGENGPEAGTNTYRYTGDISVDTSLADYGQNFTIMAQAVYYTQIGENWYRVKKDSAVSRFTFKVEAQSVAKSVTSVPTTSDDNPTTVMIGSKVQLYTETEGATILYTINGSEPTYTIAADGSITAGTNTYKYSGGVTVPDSNGETFFTITAIAYRSDLVASSISRMTFRYPDKVSSPYATPSEGTVTENTLVTLKCATEDATIYYEVAYNGETPADPTSLSNVFDESNPFKITGKTIIKAISMKDGMSSNVATFTYEVASKLSAPTASITNGNVVPSGTVITLSAETGATIYYTTDGSDPKATDNKAVMVGSSIILSGDAGTVLTIRTYASKTDYTSSDSATFTYTVSAYEGGVYADKESGETVANGDVITLGTDVSGATIYFTTDGSMPTTSSLKGTKVTVSGEPGENFTITAFAVLGGNTKSTAYASFTYVIMNRLSAPEASVPSTATFTKDGEVTLSATTGDIYYTTDGSEPTTSSTLYKKAIEITQPVTIKAITVMDGYQSSNVATFIYNMASQVETPTADTPSGELEVGTEISFECETEGAVIYYRTDGKDPTPGDSGDTIRYTGPIAITKATNFKVIAVKDYMQSSDILRISYTVKEIVIPEETEEEDIIDSVSDGRLQSKRNYSEGSEGPSFSDVVMKNAVYGIIATGEEGSTPEGASIAVEVVQVTNAVDERIADRLSNVYKAAVAYNITLKVGDEISEPLTEIEIGIPIPSEYQNAVVELVRINDDGTVSTLSGRRSGSMIYVITDELGEFALAVPSEYEETGSFPWIWVISGVVIVLILVGGILIYTSRKARTKEEDE